MFFKFTKINITMIDILVEISEANFGYNYLTFDYFYNIINDENFDGWCVVDNEDVIVGFLFFYKTSIKEIIKNTKDISLKEDICNNSNIICLDTMVILPKYRKLGIGKKLIYKVLNVFKDYSFIMYAWKYNNTINMKSIANKMGFTKLREYKDLWKEDCENNKFICCIKSSSSRGCVCSTVLFFRP